MTLESVDHAMYFEPIDFIERVSPTPLLMMVARNDIRTPTDLQLEAYEAARQPKEMAWLEGGHYDPYEGQFDRATDLALDFLRRRLPPGAAVAPVAEAQPAPTSAWRLIEATARRQPHRSAIRFLTGADPASIVLPLSYRMLSEEIAKVSQFVAKQGFGPSDVVAFMLPNVPQAHFLLWGAQMNARIAPINPLLSPEHAIRLLDTLGAKALFALAPHPTLRIWETAVLAREKVRSLRLLVQVGGDPAVPAPGAEAHYAGAVGSLPPEPIDLGQPERVSALFHTGGTTGSPKVVQLTQANQLAAVRGVLDALRFDAADVVVAPLPLFHIAGAVVAGLAPFAGGATVVMPGAAGFRDPAMARQGWKMMARERATVLAAVPTSLGALLTVPTAGADLSALQFTLTGTAALPAEVGRRFEEVSGAPVLEALGMTETAGAVAFGRRGEPDTRGNVGRAVTGLQMKLVAMDGQGFASAEVPHGQVGRVLLRGPGVFKGYLDPRHDEGVVGPDGWFDTGDLGRLDARARLTLTGRSKDLIIRSGHNIDPAAIEEAALAHPAVKAAAAVGRPDDYAGEVPVLFVELEPEAAKSIDPDRLLGEIGAAIHEPPARPRSVTVIESIPLTAVGKVFKPELKRLAAAAHLQTGIEALAAQGRVQVTLADTGRLQVQVEGLPPDAATREAVARWMGRFDLDAVIGG
jgi:fatty-acyl-CoA synthase